MLRKGDAVTDPKMLQRGDQVPHFKVRTVGGEEFSYSTIWQRKNLLLVFLRPVESGGKYVSGLRSRTAGFEALETECVITREDVPGVRAPGALIADRWGEIIYITAVAESARSPAPEDLLGWLEYVQNRCPECEGEVK